MFCLKKTVAVVHTVGRTTLLYADGCFNVPVAASVPIQHTCTQSQTQSTPYTLTKYIYTMSTDHNCQLFARTAFSSAVRDDDVLPVTKPIMSKHQGVKLLKPMYLR